MTGRILYFFGWVAYRILFKGLYRTKVVGLENVPSKGGVIIASNHLSLADPPLVGASIYRPIFYMAKKELFRGVFGWVLKKVNAFPVEREGGDLKAMRRAKKVLHEGNTLLIFPQGTRKHTDDKDAKNGAGILSCWTGCPIVPCCVINTDKMKSFKRLEVHFSVPIYPPKEYTRKDYETLTDEALKEIKKIKNSHELRRSV